MLPDLLQIQASQFCYNEAQICEEIKSLFITKKFVNKTVVNAAIVNARAGIAGTNQDGYNQLV